MAAVDAELGEDVARPAGLQVGLGVAAGGVLKQAAQTARRSPDFAATYAGGEGPRASQHGLMILIHGY